MYARGVCNKAVKDAIYSRIITAIQSVALTLTLILVPIQTFYPAKDPAPSSTITAIQSSLDKVKKDAKASKSNSRIPPHKNRDLRCVF
jgi:Ni,Fe-hydrogenase III small subunit